MSKKVITALTFALIFSLFALGTQNHSVYADSAATAKATEKPEVEGTEKPEVEGTKEANDSPFCAGINPGAATPEANGPQEQPRAARIAAAYGVTYKEVIGWFCKGYGFGQIDKAYALAKLISDKSKTKLNVASVFAALDSGKGWGEIVSAAGFSMKDVNQARKAAIGNGSKGKDDGNGNGNGKGKGKNKGKGNGNGNGNGNKGNKGNKGGDNNDDNGDNND